MVSGVYFNVTLFYISFDSFFILRDFSSLFLLIWCSKDYIFHCCICCYYTYLCRLSSLVIVVVRGGGEGVLYFIRI